MGKHEQEMAGSSSIGIQDAGEPAAMTAPQNAPRMAAQPIRPALIVNPKSAKNNAAGRRLVQHLKDRGAALPIHVLDDFSKLPDMLGSCARDNINAVFISSGDGTVQEIQTLICETDVYPFVPNLAILPHGTTNMTAAEYGFGTGSASKIAAFLAAPDKIETAIQIKKVPTIRIANPADGKPRHGMFLGTGAIYHAVRFCQGSVHATGLKGGTLAPAATLITAIAKYLFLPANPSDESRLDRPFDMTVRADGKVRADGPELTMMASTLNKLLMGCNPFWGQKDHALRASIFPYPPPMILRWILPTLYGSDDRKMPPSCRSFSASQLEISTTCPFVLDGEFFDPPSDQPMRVGIGSEFSYLCLK